MLIVSLLHKNSNDDKQHLNNINNIKIDDIENDKQTVIIDKLLELKIYYDNALETFIDFSKDDNKNQYIEDCSTCYYNCRGICSYKGINIKFPKQYPRDCWLYRDSITMRTKINYQDNYDEIDNNYD